MAAPFTDTPKIGVDINNPVAKADMPSKSHRDGSKVFASDGKTYEFTVDDDTGIGTWAEVT